MKNKYKSSTKLFFLSILIIINFYKFSYSEIINQINVKGNERLADETIILFSELNINDNINSNDLNSALKKLFETDYFKDVKINIKNGNLEIFVEENPLIQQIKITGIENKSIVKDLLKITKKIEKYPYLENKINDQKNLLLNIVRNNGFYFANVETKIQDNNKSSRAPKVGIRTPKKLIVIKSDSA